MKTASFFTYSGPGRVSIARYAPRGVSGYCRYPALAPRRDMLKMPYEQYVREFSAILGQLDPVHTADELARLVRPDEPVLLCWERPPFSPTNWCHRRMVAEWFEKALGVVVPEYKPESWVPPGEPLVDDGPDWIRQ